MPDIQATFFVTLIDEWVRAGVTDSVVCPGNRSTLLSALLEMDDRIDVHVMVDERSASFFALGLGKSTGRPALFWCTSGTATAQAHSAVIEAHYAQVPLLVCTANRPPEAQHVRDWQSVDQTQLYAGMTRWHFAPGVADASMSSSWRSIASRSVAETMFNPAGAGPVHLDLAIREPWTLEIGNVPPGRPENAPWHQYLHPSMAVSMALFTRDSALLADKRGVFVVGESDVDADALYEAATALGWPVFAEARSGARQAHANCVTAYDAITRTDVAKPEIVIRIGTPPISKAVATWAAAAEEWVIDPFNTWAGSKNESAIVVQSDPTEFCLSLIGAKGDNGEWLKTWQSAEEAAQRVFDEMLTTLTEPAIARSLATQLDADTNLFAATSMPVRDVEAFSSNALKPTVFANRGASGMEGLISTAAGVAIGTEQPTVLLVGDLSFLYDLNALWALPELNLTIVVVDNNGGGIFSTLPQLDGLSNEVFERVVATPHNVDIANVAESLGVTVEDVVELNELMPAVTRALAAGGLRMVYAETDRIENAKLHTRLITALR